MKDGITNNELFVYCISRADTERLKYTEKYSEYRRKSEKCGKKLQDAEKLFNAYKQNKIGIGKETASAKILNQYYNLKETLFNNQLIFLNDKEKANIEKMMNLSENYQYNQKWHWVIGYYLYSIIDSMNMDKKKSDWNQIIHPWRPKGRILNDILMYLWLIEISQLDVPEEVRRKIDEIGKMNCQHANIEDDIELINIFKNLDSEKLWNDLSARINKYIEER